jgi:O-antigen/teichoic acid export membrane protein
MDLRRLIRNISSQWLALGAQLLISVLMTPFMVLRLGKAGYGIVALISGLVGYSGILYFGLGAAVVKFVAEHHAREDYDELNATCSTIFGVYLAFGALCFVLALALLGPLPYLFKIPVAHADDARIMLALMGLGLLVQFPGSVYGGVLMGLERFDVMNKYNFVLLILRSAAVFTVLLVRPTVVLVGAVTMASLIAEQAFAYVYAKRTLPRLQLSLARFERARLKVLFTFSGQSFLFTLSEKLINYTDEFVIAQARGPDAVTLYVIPLRLVDYARDALDKATLVLMPGVSATAARGDIAALQSLWRFGNKAVMCLVAPVALVFLMWGGHVLALWLGNESYGREGMPILFWLALAFIAQVAGRGIARPIFEGLGELSTPARITVAEGVVNLLLSIVLVRLWGVRGVAFATFLPAAVTGLAVMPWFVCKRLGTSYLKHLGNTFLRTLPPLVPCVALLRVAERYGFHLRLVPMAGTCLAVLVVYLFFAWWITFKAADRQVIMARLGRG